MIFFTQKKILLVGAFLAFVFGTSAEEVCRSKCIQQFKDQVILIYDMAAGVKLRIKDVSSFFLRLWTFATRVATTTNLPRNMMILKVIMTKMTVLVFVSTVVKTPLTVPRTNS